MISNDHHDFFLNGEAGNGATNRCTDVITAGTIFVEAEDAHYRIKPKDDDEFLDSFLARSLSLSLTSSNVEFFRHGFVLLAACNLLTPA